MDVWVVEQRERHEKQQEQEWAKFMESLPSSTLVEDIQGRIDNRPSSHRSKQKE